MSTAAVTGCTGTGPDTFTSYLNWFDNASPGMAADNIHILNLGRGPIMGCVIVGDQGVPWGAGSRQETYVTMPPGTYGGPVRVTVTGWLAGAAYTASQRVQFYSSFNEVEARNAQQASTTSFFNWYDNASPGIVNDNIHVLNPGASSADVIVSLPGTFPQSVTVGAGAEAYVTFPAGTIGGPVMVSSTQPVLASQRVQLNQSFSEVWASSPSEAATKSYFTWFDSASPGVAYDNIHVLNPGNTTANVTASLPGAAPKTVSVAPGFEAYVSFPSMIGGPVTVSSDQPVLASERVQFYSSFNEIWSASGAPQLATTSWFHWYDNASAGMFNDNIHLANPGSVDATVTVNLTLDYSVNVATQTVIVPAGSMRYVNFPGKIGGPVTVSSNQPVLASQRVQFYQSFNEAWAR